MGGLSIDNVVRIHRVAPAEWYLLQVSPEAIDGGDWRLPDER